MSDDVRRELGEVLALLSHDLKNPLAAVLTNLGFVASALDDPSAVEDAKEAVVDARLACESMQRFVGNLELLARDSVGRSSLPPYDTTPLDVHALVEDVVDRQREAAAGRRLLVTVKTREPRTYARADRDLSLRALENLVANAVQCAPTGSEIELVVQARLGDAREAEVVVRDDGLIVPADLRETVSTPIGQVLSKGRQDARYSRGLGLYAAFVAARAAGGRVEIGEDEGRSALRLILPCHEDDDGRPSQV